MRKQYGTFYSHNTRDIPGEYFPMPKSIFRRPTAGEILVYTYLRYYIRSNLWYLCSGRKNL